MPRENCPTCGSDLHQSFSPTMKPRLDDPIYFRCDNEHPFTFDELQQMRAVSSLGPREIGEPGWFDRA